jgi:ubiquinone/menaquinone biosynthesis C-methylase UbiE
VILALDLSLPMLQKGRAVAEEKGYTSILFARADAHELPVRDSAADVLNCFGALHLFEDPARALHELGRVARPGALFTCLTACRSSDPEQRRSQQEFSRQASFHFFALDELRAELRSAGFEAFEPTQVGSVLMFSVVRS